MVRLYSPSRKTRVVVSDRAQTELENVHTRSVKAVFAAAESSEEGLAPKEATLLPGFAPEFSGCSSGAD